jgi:hypothetical protein
MEKSLIILGSEASVVSLITTAFVHLLKPFKWAGVFVPILPPLAQEILDAPVPYIVGIVDRRYFTTEATLRPAVQISPTASILYVDDFVRYPNEYLPQPVDYESLKSTISHADQNRRSGTSLGGFSGFHDQTLLRAISFAEENRDIPLLRFFEPSKLENDYFSHQNNFQSNGHQSQTPGRRNCGITSTAQLLLHVKELTLSTQYLAKQYLFLYMNINHFHHYYDPNTHSMNYLIRKLLLENHKNHKLYAIIKKLLILFYNYNYSYCSEILTHEFSWQNIATVQNNMLNINIEKLLLPLKLTISFQENICSTQMFASMVDQSYLKYVQHAHERYLCMFVACDFD